MDARLKMSGMTDFFRHPRMSVAGIPLPFRHTRSVWRVSIRKETQMDARLKMSGMTPMRMDFP
jgi:hypothetical protein